MQRNVRYGILFLLVFSCIVLVSGAAEEEWLQLQGESPYVIVYGEGCSEEIYEALAEHTGLRAVSDEDAEAVPMEILVGETGREESILLHEGLGPYDYRIAVINQKLVLAGGSDDALLNAAAALIQDEKGLIKDAEKGMAISAVYQLSFDGARSREEYIANPDLFLCNWALEFDPPAWMLDYEEKMASFRDPAGRMMAMHHRGDWFHYPENSIEGIISSVKMGADSIEVDLRLTRDNIIVLMHDETLERTTDWEEKAGKNGLPESKFLVDWTYEELCALCLKTEFGKQTDYRIPTFREVLQVCKGRTVLMLDKGGIWDWTRDVYPLIQEYEAWQTCISSEYGVTGQQFTIVDVIKEDSGQDMLLAYRGFKAKEADQWLDRLEEAQQRGYNPIIVWSDMSKSKIKKIQDVLEALRGEVRILADAHVLYGYIEKENNWDTYFENGINYVTVDNGLRMQKYLAEKFAH